MNDARLPAKPKKKTINEVQKQNLTKIKDHYEAIPLEEDEMITSDDSIQRSNPGMPGSKPWSNKPVPGDFKTLHLIT